MVCQEAILNLTLQFISWFFELTAVLLHAQAELTTSSLGLRLHFGVHIRVDFFFFVARGFPVLAILVRTLKFNSS